jgi:hypothetical protein
MASERLAPVCVAGPFQGVDTTTGDIYIQPVQGRSMSNGDCETVSKVLQATKGRLNITEVSFAAGSIGALAVIQFGGLSGTGEDILASIPVASSATNIVARTIFDSANPGPVTGVPALEGYNYLPFTQAVQASSNLQAAGTQPALIDDFGLQTPAFGAYATQAQYGAPIPGNGTTLTFRSPALNTGTGTAVTAGTYSYAYTVVAYTGTYNKFTNPGQESSPYIDPGPGAVLSAPGAITVSTTGASAFGGTFPNDPSVKYAVNLYRYSIAQPTYFFVATVTSGTTYNDDFSDSYIAANAQLTMNRDVPPVKNAQDFGQTGVETYYPGAPLAIHKQRLFYFALVNNLDTNNSPQFQLWFSNALRPWEFDKVNNVLLVDLPHSNVQPPINSVNQFTDPYIYPQNTYMEMPIAVKSLSSVLVFWTTQTLYVLYGNDASSFIFQKLADIGCSSRGSVVSAIIDVGQNTSTEVIVFMSEDGIYLTDGATLQYISEPIREVINGLSFQDRYTCVGAFYNHTYVISFPVLGQSWSYRFTTGQWSGPIPYTASAFAAVISDPRSPSLVLSNGAGQPTHWNQVIGARTGTTYVDNWFAANDQDLAGNVSVTYTSGPQSGGALHMPKDFLSVGITHNIQNPGTMATVVLTIDEDPTRTFTYNFDLSQGPTQLASIGYAATGGVVTGFLATLTISWTTVGDPLAPIQIKNVTIYGNNSSANLIPTTGQYANQ